MKDKFKQTSIFSTLKRKLDNIKWRRGNREEPVLLGVKSTRTNCEVSDDFEYIDSRRKDSEIYCSVNSLHSTKRDTLQETSHIVRNNKLNRKKRKGMPNFYQDLTCYNLHFSPSENEIEIFERKFLAPLSVSSTRIVITHGGAGDSRVMSSVVAPAPAPSSPLPVTSSPGASVPPQHVRVLRTSSKVRTCS